MKLLSRVRFFATPWTVAHPAPPSMGSSRQEYWSGLPFPSPEDLPNPGIEPRSPALWADALTSEPPGKPIYIYTHTHMYFYIICTYTVYIPHIAPINWNTKYYEICYIILNVTNKILMQPFVTYPLKYFIRHFRFLKDTNDTILSILK